MHGRVYTTQDISYVGKNNGLARFSVTRMLRLHDLNSWNISCKGHQDTVSIDYGIIDIRVNLLGACSCN